MAERTGRNEQKSTALRIMDQYHSNGGMAYDLKCEGVRLTLVITERKLPAEVGAWKIEARAARPAESEVTVTEWGATRDDALRGVAAAWVAANDTMAFRVFDWDAVAVALRAVRAI